MGPLQRKIPLTWLNQYSARDLQDPDVSIRGSRLWGFTVFLEGGGVCSVLVQLGFMFVHGLPPETYQSTAGLVIAIVFTHWSRLKRPSFF